MIKQIITNILFSSIEKFFIIGTQFISSIMIIKLLPRADYGIIGIVSGYFVFLAFLNISFESVILKEHKKFDNDLDNIMHTFFMVNTLKSFLFIIIAFVFSIILPKIYNNYEFIFSIWSITFIIIADSITSPLILYFASKFNQKIVTWMSVIRALINLLLLLGLFIFPKLWYIALKDLVVSVVFILMWFFIANKKIGIKYKIIKIDLKFLSNTFFSYSLWTHLIGAVTNFIYKSDTFFLSFFVSIISVGNYSVALNSANVANIIPGIINYQNSIALSHVKENKTRSLQITIGFIKLSVVLGVISLAIFLFLGKYYIYLITGSFNKAITFYMNCIVTGLIIVKTFASPLISYLCIVEDIKKYFFSVILITFFSAIIVYLISPIIDGARGIAIGNILVSSIFLLSVLICFVRMAKVY